MTRRKLARTLGVAASLWLAGCSDDTTAPHLQMAAATAETAALAAEVRQLAVTSGVIALQRPAPVRRELSLLGQALAFDKILSGNRDISCMTCHLAKTATMDGRSIAIGQGGSGLGLARVHPLGKFIHRNAPPLFNLHATTPLTWDGRVFTNSSGVVRTPAGALLPSQRAVLEFGPLSALPMFPVLSRPEMRADAGNELAAIPDTLPQKVWRFLMRRLGAIPQYRTMFESAYPGQQFDNMSFAHAGNAMGGWITAVFAFNNSPWDRFLAGNDDALTDAQLRGAKAFLGTARCAQCHNGPAFTDGKFHNVLVPQIGPGFGDGPSGRDDFGRMRQTGNTANRYAFRTAPLRNVELTAPYGHDGAIVSLRAWVDHYSQAGTKLQAYDPSQLEPLLQNTLLPTAADILLTRDAKLKDLVLSSATVDDITEFLKALTDPAARDLRQFVPLSVPSGLPIDNLP
ncbi:MAG TPA: cytochrome c peroxidase [Gemmatimonadales bacterium]|jgi:cytochrome c peroxidase|nr:cytochrome c peroxidase [Gemmatimonadales bacterium]